MARKNKELEEAAIKNAKVGAFSLIFLSGLFALLRTNHPEAIWELFLIILTMVAITFWCLGLLSAYFIIYQQGIRFKKEFAKDKQERENRVVMTLAHSATRAEALAKIDDRHLCWLLWNCTFTDNLAMFDPQMDILDEVQRRLYPEFDCEEVTATDYGWLTPEGVITYK